MAVIAGRAFAMVLAAIVIILSVQGAAALCLPTNYRFGYVDYYSVALLARERQKVCEYAPADYAAQTDEAIRALREKTVAEVGEERVLAIEEDAKRMLADPRMDVYRESPTKKCMYGEPENAAETATAMRLLAYGSYNVHAVVRGEVCSSDVASADAVRHIPRIAGYYAVLGVEDQCRTLSPDFRELLAQLLEDYAAKLEGTNAFEAKLLAEALKWREWLHVNRHLDCEVYDRNQPLKALWDLVRTLQPDDASELTHKIEVAQARNLTFQFYGHVSRWRAKRSFCPLPNMTSLLGKLGDGKVVESQIVAEVGRERAARLATQYPLPYEKVEADQCQFSDAKAFASMLETLSVYGISLPLLTPTEFHDKEQPPGFLEFGELGYLEGCALISDSESAKASERLQAALAKLPTTETRAAQLRGYQDDTRRWAKHACESWAKDEFQRTLNFRLK